MTKLEKVEKFIRAAVIAGAEVAAAAAEAEKKFNVGVYIDPPSTFNVSRFGQTHFWLEVFFKRDGQWSRKAGAFSVKPTQ